MKTRNAIVAAAACCAWGTCLAAEHVVTTDWDRVSSAEYADGTGDLTAANRWSRTADVATVKGGVICLSDEDDGVLTYTPLAPAAASGIQTVVMHVEKVTAGSLDEELVAANAQASLAAVADGTATNWYGLCRTGWVKLTGAVPTTGGACDVRMEFSSAAGKIRYSAKPEGGVWTVLTAEGAADGWLDNAQAAPKTVGNVDFAGNGAFDRIDLTQTGTVTVDDMRMEKAGITAADLDKTGANGNPNWENLVLGLSCKDAASKPVVLPVQTGDPTTVRLALGGVDVDTASGATVKYTVTASDEIGGEGTATQPVSHDQPTDMALPQSGVKYYRMKVTATPM